MFRIHLLAIVVLPALCVHPSTGATLQEDFTTDPMIRGWQAFGDANLFHWSAADKNMQVTWDSSRPNSYFSLPLGTVLAKDDDFSVAFDLRLTDFAAGVDLQKPNPFQLSVAFINQAKASQPGFVRGTGANSPDLAEFSFFPDPGGEWIYGPSLTTVLVDSAGTDPGADWAYGFAGLSLTPDDLYHIEMVYTASNQTLHTQMTRNTNEVFGPISDAQLGAGFLDFRLDHIAICSYSDAGQDPQYAGSILAHGSVDNFVITVPPRPLTNLTGSFSNSVWQVQFLSRSNWLYTLERTVDFQTWTAASPAANGNGTSLVLQDTNPLGAKGFYRVKTRRP